MIQKQLFFIWIGDSKPNYVDFAIQTYKEVNPDFKIDLIRYTVSEIENWEYSNDFILRKTIKKLLNNEIHVNPNIPMNDNKYFIQHICDVYRFELLQYYGGIYLDCDTFPVKPFDEELLSKENFNVRRSLINKDGKKVTFFDSFFCGQSDPKYYLRLDRDKINHLEPEYNTLDDDKKYLELRDKFFNCVLQYGENFGGNDKYVDHYHDYRWKLDDCKLDSVNIINSNV